MTAKAFEDLGATVVETDPQLADAEAVFQTHWFASAAAAGSVIPMEKHYLLDRGLKEIISRGCNVAASDYIDAASRRAAIRRAYGSVLSRIRSPDYAWTTATCIRSRCWSFPKDMDLNDGTNGPVHLSLQFDPTAGRIGSVWLYRRRSPRGAANRRPAIFGSAGAEGGPQLRGRIPFQNAGQPGYRLEKRFYCAFLRSNPPALPRSAFR